MTSNGRDEGRAKNEPRQRRDRPVEEEADKDIKEGGMEQQQQKRPARPEHG
jgi:hypothetical protein